MGTDLQAQDINRPVGEGNQLSGLDKRLLDLAGQRLSLDEIAERLNIPQMTPARCGQRIREILKSRDWLSIMEQQAILMMDMVELRDILFQRVRDEGGIVTGKNGEDEYWSFGDPRWSANLIRLMKEFRGFIDTNRKNVEDAGSSIRKAHARLMGSAVELAFDRFVFELEQHFANEENTKPPSRAQMLSMMEGILPSALRAIDAKVVD